MNVKILLLIALGVLSIYILPSAVAKFAGSHTWEFNATSGSKGVNCVECHDYIRGELNATPATRTVYAAHRSAAGNASYTQGWLNLTIDNTTPYGVCQLCHLNQLPITSSHTKVTIRACTDLDCHGNNATTNNTAYPAGAMGPKLGGSDPTNPTNVHMRIFNQISGMDSGYLNETGSDYKKGFFFCIGCHTKAQFEIKRSGAESWNHSDPGFAKRRYL
ncbi:MAG: hypothetical protein D6733_04825 [Methanobacteriota archaeon]|nr:MAG: hypothetical protein D6733_04825 [Euryarchaeota archaeon]